MAAGNRANATRIGFDQVQHGSLQDVEFAEDVMVSGA